MTQQDADDITLDDFMRSFARFMTVANEREAAGQDNGNPSVGEVVRAHLGVDPGDVGVVTERVPRLRTVDAAVAVEEVISRHGGGRLLGVAGGDQRMHHSFSELAQNTWRQFRIGAVDYDRVAVGPHEQRRTVTFGLQLFTYDDLPVALMQRAPSPRFGEEGVIEVMCRDEDATLRLIEEIREAMVQHSDHQGLSFLLADMAAAVESARATYLFAARLRDAGRPFSRQASIAKLVATDNAMRVTTDAVQVLGGAGYTKDFPVERFMRETKVMQIFEGTNQIQRLVIGRDLKKKG